MKCWFVQNETAVYQILGGRCNVYLVCRGDSSILIDTIWKDSRPWLRVALKNLGFDNRRSLTALFLTHAHFDHAGNAAWVQQQYHPKVIIQQADASFLRAGLSAPIDSSHRLLHLIIAQLLAMKSQPIGRYSAANPDIVFENRLDLTQLGIDAYLQHTPGHTDGSASLVVGNEIAIVGDTMHGVFPGNAFPPFLTDRQKLLASWKVLLETNCEVFLPSHGKAISRELLESNCSNIFR